MVKVLLLADTHLGFDLPANPRVEKRRRGPDFFANTRLALEPAMNGEVDFVVHGGDLLYRSKVPPGLVMQALEPLLEVADAGVPVVLVPGNHERSALPYPMLASHEHLHILDRPRTVQLVFDGTHVAVGGFPCKRDGIRERFEELVSETGVLEVASDIRLLCIHQTVEGARVKNYTFRSGGDIIRGRDIPSGLAAVFCGHIHRAQILERDLAGRQLAAPVFYPGSVERTSLAEREEAKGYFMLELGGDAENGGRVRNCEFRELPARPMCAVSVDATGLDRGSFEDRIRRELCELHEDAVVHLWIEGEIAQGSEKVIRSAALRLLHPPSMTVTVRVRNPNRASRRRGD